MTLNKQKRKRQTWDAAVRGPQEASGVIWAGLSGEKGIRVCLDLTRPSSGAKAVHQRQHLFLTTDVAKVLFCTPPQRHPPKEGAAHDDHVILWTGGIERFPDADVVGPCKRKEERL